jgi:hypothetical protein
LHRPEGLAQMRKKLVPEEKVHLMALEKVLLV